LIIISHGQGMHACQIYPDTEERSSTIHSSSGIVQGDLCKY